MNVARFSAGIFAVGIFICRIALAEAPAPVFAIKEWRGEFFKKKEGGLFVKTLATGFPSTATANVQVTLYGIIQQKSFIFSNTQTSVDAYPREIWKLPSGKYRIDRVEFTDATGARRIWTGRPETPKAVIVPRVMLSNLGIWNLIPSGANGLEIKFSMGPSTYKEKNDNGSSSVAGVVNGFTGTIQQVIGGRKVVDDAENDYSDEHTLRATTTFTRQIAMYYKVNLFRHNRYAKDVSGSLAAFDLNLRTCYTHVLNHTAAIRGDIVLQVLVSAKTGTIRQAKKSAGTINHAGMIDCLIGEIMQIPMPIQENMIGELTFTFDTK